METFYFKKARAIWAQHREEEKNCELAFRTVLSPGQTVLYLAASTLYRLWVNGEFVGAGPARTSHGYFVVDQIDVSDRLTKNENVVVIEVVGFNVNTYDTLDQLSFLTVEIFRDGQLIAYTGGDEIKIYDLNQRVQRVQRYSFQRGFAESYRLMAKNKEFFIQPDGEWHCEQCAVQEVKNYLKRGVRMPKYEKLTVSALLETGLADFDYICPQLVRDRSFCNVGELVKGYRPNELEDYLSDEAQYMKFQPLQNEISDAFPLSLHNGYGIYEFPFDATGFLRLDVKCEEDCTVYLLFDEILKDGKVDSTRMTNCNSFKYRLDAGCHKIMTFAPYTMKYVQVVVRGSCRINSMDMVEYKHPPVSYKVNLPKDEKLELIYQAALETYLANAVDVFTDCPSRERAGWLCDSFFTARVEKVLTGESMLEQAFLKNFLRAESFPHLPAGMLPMCYPADHNDGNFIPNWAMWFVLELEEYQKRSGDCNLIAQAKKRVYGLLDYFSAFENEDGLLERLDKWVFVEWSRANDADVVQDINFPSNMLYMKMLYAISKLYGDDGLAKKAEHLRSVLRNRSRKGIFYTDNERRTSEGLVNPGNCTEVCQYYAFFTGVATKQEDSELWEILCRDFGYQRKKTGLYPEVAFANAFIGNYLRIELLYLDGKYEEVVDSIRGYFTTMAELTGTLWEHDSPYASCNHGFASHVIYWMAGIYGIHKL